MEAKQPATHVLADVSSTDWNMGNMANGTVPDVPALAKSASARGNRRRSAGGGTSGGAANGTGADDDSTTMAAHEGNDGEGVSKKMRRSHEDESGTNHAEENKLSVPRRVRTGRKKGRG